jgi:hypothetical protein
MARRERRKLDPSADEERIGRDEQGVGPVAHEGGEGRLDFAAGAGVEDLNLQSDSASSPGDWCEYASRVVPFPARSNEMSYRRRRPRRQLSS